MAAVYTGPYGNLPYYFGYGTTAVIPALMGGLNNPHAFLSGRASAYLQGAAASTLPPRAVRAYSTVSGTLGLDFTTRLLGTPLVLMGATVGPMPAIFPDRSVAAIKPY